MVELLGHVFVALLHTLCISVSYIISPQSRSWLSSLQPTSPTSQSSASTMSTTTVHTVHGYLDLSSSAQQRSLGPRRTSTPQTRRQQGRILLNTRNALLLVCPLLPTKQPVHALSIPEEVWRQILDIVLGDIRLLKRALAGKGPPIVIGADLLSVCKAFKVRFFGVLCDQDVHVDRYLLGRLVPNSLCKPQHFVADRSPFITRHSRQSRHALGCYPSYPILNPRALDYFPRYVDSGTLYYQIPTSNRYRSYAAVPPDAAPVTTQAPS